VGRGRFVVIEVENPAAKRMARDCVLSPTDGKKEMKRDGTRRVRNAVLTVRDNQCLAPERNLGSLKN